MTHSAEDAEDADIAAARLVLARMGVTAEQLLVTPTQRGGAVPTFDQYIPKVAEATSAGARRAYRPYWDKIARVWGQRPIDEPTALEIKRFAEQTKNQAIVRRNSRGGRSAAEHLVAALRCIYRFAETDGLISETPNPALRVAKPRRLASPRRALPTEALGQITTVAAATGRDSDLDTLLLRLHIETACRRGGALALRPLDLDPTHCLIMLREKGETVRWQPVSPTLMHLLMRHRHQRENASAASLLRYRNGSPLTPRRYDSLWRRIGNQLPWVAAQQISIHWLRHTTLTWVERNFGYATARAYAGHTGNGDAGTTATYVRADLPDVARALAALTGETHPLARELQYTGAHPLLQPF